MKTVSRKRYAPEFKTQAVGLVNLGKLVSEVVEDLGIGSSLLYGRVQNEAQSTQVGGGGGRAADEGSPALSNQASRPTLTPDSSALAVGLAGQSGCNKPLNAYVFKIISHFPLRPPDFVVLSRRSPPRTAFPQSVQSRARAGVKIISAGSSFILISTF